VTRAAGLPVPLAVVHHANQYLLIDGYENRHGLTQITAGYKAVLRLHEGYGIPASLHLSGTLLEALAWGQPEFLTLVRRLMAEGLLTLVGGAYAENVMTLFPPDFNRRQLEELLWLYQRHLACPPERVKACWIPERVWDTGRLASVLASDGLPNGGYRFVLLDDRLLFSSAGGRASARAAFDAAVPYGPLLGSGTRTDLVPLSCADLRAACRPYRVAGGHGLAIVPISANLRYWLPPDQPEQFACLSEMACRLGADESEEPTLLVYGDDLEKTAGVGGWVPALDRYEAFLRWLVEPETPVTPVLLDTWLERHPPRHEVALDPGTFFELAREWKAGEDYRGWAESPSWSSYRRHFEIASKAVEQVDGDQGDTPLVELAWKHLLASSHETAWQDAAPSGRGRAPAPWAKAVASHARACLPIVAAAEWFAPPEWPALGEARDVDADGDDEIVLANEHLLAVLSPRYGARLVYLFQRTSAGGVLLVGNPTDHWNFQEALNRYMDVPQNHPGALADVGFEHDSYEVAALDVTPGHVLVDLVNTQEGSRAGGARKSIVLLASEPALLVRYRLPSRLARFETEACLSPDYLRLLREGREGLRTTGGDAWRGFRNGAASVWLALEPGEKTAWAEPTRPEAGHGLIVRAASTARQFDLLVGCGEPDGRRCRRLFTLGRGAFQEPLVDLDGGRPAARGKVRVPTTIEEASR
jgi:starch synthase